MFCLKCSVCGKSLDYLKNGALDGEGNVVMYVFPCNCVEQGKEEAVEALRFLLENYKHNDSKGLGMVALTKAKNVLKRHAGER